MPRTTREVAKAKRYIRKRLRYIEKIIKINEDLLKAASRYRASRIGATIDGHIIGLDVAVSIILMATPNVIKENKKKRTLFNRALRRP